MLKHPQHYGKLLQQRFPDIPIDFQDERLTTVAEAHRMLVEEADISRAKQKKVIDEVAAAYIHFTKLFGSPWPPCE